MATVDTDESMEIGENGGGSVKPPTPADVVMMTESQSKDEVQVVLPIKWEEGILPEQYKTELTKALQTWANINKITMEFKVEVASDYEASIKINPASVLPKLLEAKGQTLSNKRRKIVTLVSMSPPENAPMNLPSPSGQDPQHGPGQQQGQGELSSPVADSAAEEETYTCKIPFSFYCYMNNIHKEKIDRIEAENGVKIVAQVTVKIEPDKENGDRRKAISEFRNLAQTSYTEYDGFSIPLEVMARDAINKSLNTTIQKTSTSTKPSVGEPTRSSHDTPQTIGMTINDPLVYAGIDIEESVWRLMTASFNEQVAKLKAKFNVDFKEADIGQGQVNIKARSRRSEQNKSMESHAVRALLRLYQRIGTSPKGLTKCYGVSGFNSSLKTNDYQTEGASGGAVSNGTPGNSRGNTEEPTGGTVAVREEDATCSICRDKFTDKIQLKCGHEFCNECLRNLKMYTGAICPLCRYVFDVVEGDQPSGKMSWKILGSSLDGFPDCDTIVITYDIPNGKQTTRHPNPGQHYFGCQRNAYLPNNSEGREVRQLLDRAFKQKLIFTVGMSRTSGNDNQVTWNDIHHKTSLSGGPESYGYPDPGYLSRVREELKAKGIK